MARDEFILSLQEAVCPRITFQPYLTSKRLTPSTPVWEICKNPEDHTSRIPPPTKKTTREKSRQWALATYLIPGCVKRGVRLRSESSSGGAGAGAVWKSGNLGTWKSRNLEIWGPGNPRIWRSWDLEIQKFRVKTNNRTYHQKSKSILPKMLARSGLVSPIWNHLGQF